MVNLHEIYGKHIPQWRRDEIEREQERLAEDFVWMLALIPDEEIGEK